MDAPPKITGYRSKAINAVRDFAAATVPVAGFGLTAADTPGGRVLGLVQPGGVPLRDAWSVEAFMEPGGSSSVELRVRVYLGLVVMDGADLAYGDEPAGTDAESGLQYAEFSASDVGGDYLCAASGDDGQWDFAWKDSPIGEDDTGKWRAVAKIAFSDGVPSVTRYESGVIDLSSGIHFGAAEEAVAQDEWSVDDDKPAILEIPDADGGVLVKVLVDSRGNVVAWNGSAGEEGEEPSDPSARKPAPPCGNPLNADGGGNPLDDGGGGGTGGARDANPLDSEGDGGFTPLCYGDDAA